MERLRRVAGRAEPVDRLPHLADRPAVEREGRDLEHRLVTVVEGVEPVRAVERRGSARSAEDGDAPVALACERDEPLDEPVNSAGGRSGRPRPPRLPDDAVGEEGALVLAEEVRLVGAQREGGEVSAPHEATARARLPLALLRGGGSARREPRREQPPAAASPRMKTDTGNHSPNASPTWADPPSESRRASGGLRGDEAEGVRLVGRDPVDPERAAPYA
jgi:hypothetical protein